MSPPVIVNSSCLLHLSSHPGDNSVCVWDGIGEICIRKCKAITCNWRTYLDNTFQDNDFVWFYNPIDREFHIGKVTLMIHMEGLIAMNCWSNTHLRNHYDRAIFIGVKQLQPKEATSADFRRCNSIDWPVFIESPNDIHTVISPEWVLQVPYFAHNHTFPNSIDTVSVDWTSDDARYYYFQTIMSLVRRSTDEHGVVTTKIPLFCGLIFKCGTHDEYLCKSCYRSHNRLIIEGFCNLNGSVFNCPQHGNDMAVCMNHNQLDPDHITAPIEWRFASIYQGAIDRFLRQSVLITQASDIYSLYNPIDLQTMREDDIDIANEDDSKMETIDDNGGNDDVDSVGSDAEVIQGLFGPTPQLIATLLPIYHDYIDAIPPLQMNISSTHSFGVELSTYPFLYESYLYQSFSLLCYLLLSSAL